MGGHLVETTHTSRDKLGYEQGDNVGETQRPLLSPEEIMFHFAAKKMLILAQGMHPIIADRVPYYVDDRLKGKWVDPRKPVTHPFQAAYTMPPQKPIGDIFKK